ncbi:ferritin-like domain-containing protein [Dokdonia sp. Hel_I_53]|uniref:ferritin-like domain-containing protein n=1 Tax=Dokdonia sp. Hel_I_53 TaxID=1566287 RepID=UPI00119B654D|nr:PA2169 family four-helix-bundle protein [Dokdonia sp. Hel_I_53]TVZ53374.1 uncharacterized protein (TIGR02284 family) [Dokdonia sp. Hel_I_53]
MEKTVVEIAQEDEHKKLVDNLQNLIEKNYDAEEGYKKAMEKADNMELKKYLNNRAVLRNGFAQELSNTVLGLNETPKTSGSTTGVLHRTWMNLVDAFSSNSDEGILEECIRGEKASVEEYKEFLEDTRLPENITATVTNQMFKVEETLSEIKYLEDIV